MALTLLLGLELRRGAASTATDRLFQSVLPSPTAVHTAPRMPTRTATVIGGRTATPTRTPTRTATSRALAPLLGAAKRHLPLALKGWPPTPTFTLTATPTATVTPTQTSTPTPTPIQYGWKGAGYAPNKYIAATPTVDQLWGLNVDWWYDWGLSTERDAAHSASSPEAILAVLANGLKDPRYVPMIYCTSDAGGPDPDRIRELARQYPGRVWLIFNEPDNTSDCGGSIYPKHPVFYDGRHWPEFGAYLAQEYAKYHDAIKSADPTARLYPLGLLELPMPSKTPGSGWGNQAIQIWNGFTDYLAATTTPAPQRTPRPFDGIAVHAYPWNYSTFHSGCQTSFVDVSCVQNALADAHRFFQGTPGPASTAIPNGNANYQLTAAKPTWITETGCLTSKSPRAEGPPAQSQATTRAGFQEPMVTWFKSHIGTGQDCQYINAVSWFSTHACGYDYSRVPTPAPTPSPGPSPTPPVIDNTASDLLDIGALACPLQQSPATRNLTVVGQYWRDATCPTCECPRPGCQ